MHLSWSHKLFLRINAQVGKRRWLDLFMIFCARRLIYLIVVTWGVLIYHISKGKWWVHILATVFTCGFAYLASVVIGIVWRHRRPEMELPNVRTIVKTITTWKSFPSDHTIFAVCIALLAVYFSSHLIAFLLLLAALLVAISRVYVGVHYPRDIIGGISVAVVSFTFYYLLIARYYALFISLN